VKTRISILALTLWVVSCARQTELDVHYREFMANTTDTKLRALATLEYRMDKYSKLHGGYVGLLRISDGIDQLEALLLARTFITVTFGSEMEPDLPVLNGGTWVVPTSFGLSKRDGYPVLIDARSGRIDYRGYESVTDPERFVRRPYSPNKSPDPTSRSVTPPADAGDRAAAGRGSS
jgi:hypothetical protein